MPTMDYGNYNPKIVPDSDDVLVGQSTIDRATISSATVVAADQQLRLCYFTSKKLETVTKVRLICGTVAAAATPTLIRIGLYREEADGGLTLVASTPNDTTLFAATQTAVQKNFSAPFDIQKGIRYAVAILVVSAVATPTLHGQSTLVASEQFMDPKASAYVPGIADLPSTVAVGSLVGSGSRFYAVVSP